ncbi:PKD domain-containing protein [Taibaiella koreensis]|uniref:PKD domain-containing protein n=1 Tax=Taibaiella koreensis TaxID=1268548 RepID=UPI000E59AFF4|nr:PKD domain-containing protein [Taibaiella koreensis]
MNQKLLLHYWKACFACFVLLHIAGIVHGQKKRVLFVGNSYTYTNNLPQMVKNVAASAGDTVECDMSAAGAAAWYQHLDSTITVLATLSKIRQGGWDYVVLQEQSQAPAYPPDLFYEWVYPYARQLVDTVKRYNPCAEVIFYMTWGRENGDTPSMCNGFPNWPFYCTYLTMDSVIRARYMLMADSNKVTVSPVGPVWRYIRAHYPGIGLYASDGSHPSLAGSYAAACSFYTAIFKKPADSIRSDYMLSPTDAANIRNAATRIAYDSMGFWSIGRYETIARFNQNTGSMLSVSFTNTSVNATQYEWDFGDGQTATVSDPSHTYATPGVYTARLVATGASQCSDTAYARINVGPLSISGHDVAAPFTIAPNPATDILYIQSPMFTRENCRIQIRNGIGQLLYERQATRATVQPIDVSQMKSGVYLLQVTGAAGKPFSKKITIR